MNNEAFETECPECGTVVYVYSPRRSRFCSKMCESNYKYRRKFDSAQKEQRPTFDDVRRFGVAKFDEDQ